MRFRIRTGVSRTAPLLLLLALISCSGAVPNSAIPDNLAERRYGIRTATTPLVALIHGYNLYSPDPASAVPLLDQLQRELAKSDPNGRQRGITFDLTRGNRLDRDWIVQSPDRWGRSSADLPFYPLQCKDGACEKDVALPSCSSDADCGGGTCGTIWPASGARGAPRCKVCLGHSDALIDRLQALVAGARSTVDIMLLQPAADGRFVAALRSGLAEVARSGRPVEARVLVGQYPPAGTDAAAFLKELIAEARDAPRSRLSVHVAAMRSCTVLEKCDSFSWNHAKIVTVDGRTALVGGHNMWSADVSVVRTFGSESVVD